LALRRGVSASTVSSTSLSEAGLKKHVAGCEDTLELLALFVEVATRQVFQEPLRSIENEVTVLHLLNREMR
jgi:hypothetical protein